MIPDYQTLMLPLLKFISDDKIHSKSEAISAMGKFFNLSEEELATLLPNKKNFVIHNRVHWARAHLKMAGLIENVSIGNFKITEKGKMLLSENPSELNIRYLRTKFENYDEKISFRIKKNNEPTIIAQEIVEANKLTPEELIDQGYVTIKKNLEIELLSKLKSVHPSFFEKIVVELLVKMGYGGSIQDAGKAIGKSGDEGIDGIIKEDKLGLDLIYIQAKRWEGVIGRPEIQKFVGALAGQRAKKGVFLTTSYFTKEATTYAAQMDTKIVLIDGEQLSQYMIDYNLGVSVQNIYEIKKIDSDYFEEE